MLPAGTMDGGSPSILMLCTFFSMDDTSRDLMREIADALVERGARVQVCVINWNDPSGSDPELRRLPNGIEVLSVAPWKLTRFGRLVGNVSKWVGSSLFATAAMKRSWHDRQIDLLLDFSPLVVTMWPILWAKRRYKCLGYAYLTDFFPFHHRAAGLNLGYKVGFNIALWLETFLLRRFETVACMSQAGISYVKTHYRLRSTQRVRLLHLWGDTRLPVAPDRDGLRAAHSLPANRPIILFGGQITEGRGIEEMLEVAARAHQTRPDLVFLFMGKGRLTPLVQAHIDAGGDNVILKPPVDRDDYLDLVTSCDIGVVSTVANTNVPSFPSKTIDYLRAGVPIVASVEDSTDYSEFVERNGFGVATLAGNPDAFLSALLRVLDDPTMRKQMVVNGRKALDRYFDVNSAASTILSQAFEQDQRHQSVE